MSRLVGALLVVGLLAFGHAAEAGPLLVEEAAHYREQGRQYQAAGKMTQAIDAFSKAVLSHPAYAEAHNDLGVLY